MFISCLLKLNSPYKGQSNSIHDKIYYPMQIRIYIIRKTLLNLKDINNKVPQIIYSKI